MKKSFLFFMSASFILAMSINVFAQSHEKYLAAPTSQVFLNQIIMGDTLSDGSRVDMDRVYVLQRGGTWFFNDEIKNIGWDIRIKAEDGTGALPLIYGSVATGSTNVPSNFINAQGNVYVKDIVVNAIQDWDEDYKAWKYGAMNNIIVFNTAGDYSMVVDGCILMHAYGADLRTFASIRSLKVSNTIFACSGTGSYDDVGEGRAIDIRKTSLDTLLVYNCTMVNGNDRIIRHMASEGRLKNLIFEHNTVVNNGGRYGIMALGLIGDNIRIKNNLFVDAMAFGADTSSQRQWDFKENKEAFSESILDKMNMVMIYHQKEETPYATTFDVSNNYYAYTKDIKDTWASCLSFNPSLKMPAPFSNYISEKVGSNAMTLVDAFPMKNVPKPMSGFVYWNLSPLPEGAGENSSGGTNFVDLDRRNTIYYRDTMDCSYSTSIAAYSAGTGGYPLGDLNWFPTKKAEWLTAGGWTDVEQINSIPSEFSLEQNYPNPFNPTTKITYSLPKESKVSLEVFNILGQKVATLVNNSQAAGSYSVNFNASKLSSGLYIYRLITSEFSISKKMMLMK